MPTSKRRGKKYTPKPIATNSLAWALAGAHLMPATRQAELFDRVNAAFNAFRTGGASLEQWYTIDNGLRLSEALIGLNIGNNLAPQIADGRRALDVVGARLRETGSSTFYADELELIHEAIDLYRIQIGLCTQAEMSKAVRRVRNLIMSAEIIGQKEVCNE